MRITDVALVAAATAIYMRHAGSDWDAETSEVKGMFLRDAQAALNAAAPFLAGAAGLDPECDCALKGCIHQPALSDDGRRRVMLERNREVLAEEIAKPLVFRGALGG